MTIVLFDKPEARASFYPLSNTRPLCHLRLGIFTLREKWKNYSGINVSALTENYLSEHIVDTDMYLYVDATVLPSEDLVEIIVNLKDNERLEYEGKLISFKAKSKLAFPINVEEINANYQLKTANCQPSTVNQLSDLFKNNEAAIRSDFAWITKDRFSAPWPTNNQLFGNQLFVEEGVDMKGCIVNTETGPVYIGKNALVMEGTVIRGPVSIGEGAVVKMGSKLYSGTTIGPYCTAGGEIKNSILIGYSNKAHDGYLGDSVIGAWCNLGAGTTNSNVKNTAGEVKMWHQPTKLFQAVGLKAGLIMGDYSRSAINTSFNTGTTVGVCCNVFEAGFPPKHIPSFTWGKERYDLQKALKDIDRWKTFKSKNIEDVEIEMLKCLYENDNE